MLASRVAILTFRAIDRGLSMTETDVVERRRAPEIPLHGPADFEGMRRAGRMVAECLDMLSEHVKPGVTTDFLD